LERVLDPAVKSPWLWLLAGRIVGGDAARERAAKTGHFDYDTPLPALEIVDQYGHDIGAHPVGTGPYMLGEYRRSARIVLVANPGFRDTRYVPTGPIPA